MIARIQPRKLRGEIPAIPSKSEAHRALICAALADAPTTLFMGPGSEDIDATIRCLTAFGAKIRREGSQLLVEPVLRLPEACTADCGESGSTLRFMLPVAGALGLDVCFRMHGRLPRRPIAPLDRELEAGGCLLSRPEEDILHIRGKLRPGSFELPGNISSQYISGMLFALSLLNEESRLNISGKTESAGYIEMTLKTLAVFGAMPEKTASGWRIPGMGRYRSPGSLQISGDWSNAAFWLCANAIEGCSVSMTGLDDTSAQGDRRIVEELKRIRLSGSSEIIIDAADIPDLVPVLAATACARGQDMRVIRAERLRIKESDRLESVSGMLNQLGARVLQTQDGLIVDGRAQLTGGEVHAGGDHRIAMSAAIASCACSSQVCIRGAEAVNKSYPGFWTDFEKLGGCVQLSEED